MQPLWYRNAVVYSVDPGLFADSNGDGWGDLAGLSRRLDYLRGLGATCLWLLPFFPTPYRDGGYDIADYLSVDPRFGDLADFADLLDNADHLGIRVLIELVLQHTSDEHPWFQEARHDRRSKYRDYYVWADEPEPTEIEQVFPGEEEGVWTWDEEAQQFYRHTFYRHEPDLQVGHPDVRAEIRRIMAFWLRLGVSGFRIDAAPYMVERARAVNPDKHGHWLLEDLRQWVAERAPDAVLLGEVDVEVDRYADYFGDGDQLTLLLDFWTNNHLFLALSRGDAAPLAEAIRRQPMPPRNAQYANWLRNHDELDLERLSPEEREEVMQAFGPEPDMQAFGRGIRRRLAPMLGGDERRIIGAHAVLLSLPGMPILRYGDEIGMGEQLSRTGRLAVRTPMQWSDGPGAGFSTADPADFAAPLVTEERFDQRQVNVFEQIVREDSVLAKVSRMVRSRLGMQEIGLGRCHVLDVGCRAVLGLLHEHEGSSVVTLVNLSADDVEVRLDQDDLPGELVDLLADENYPDPERHGSLKLRGYGYRWLRQRDRVLG